MKNDNAVAHRSSVNASSESALLDARSGLVPALGDKGAEQLEETLEIGGKHGGGKARGWSEMAYNKLPNAMQSVGLGQDLFRAAKKDPQLASTLKEAAVGYWKKAKGIPEPGAFPADPAAAAAAAPASAAVESKSRLRGQGRARPSA